ncbi:hypothetical protein AC578_2470 [Pseudocercospora eumusae]|uniref:BTB domain-containing protein n=1 Tax=Pseudocercospora eumusae TaxID=321146 RepID=A0A139HXL4_9PEZI|nr:hypothetical protein AC578_2470 [Pseudocercospora eumusae]KXT07191.1 hypothetical protein AC578_2470 [Pseudocercospora eumusae]KXT07193.1 hypothetical protein AC578_2470 [Pseudocercospora eumusae]KXT07195.1 hypothetical protein AC578_2470 [Pseudocercospora eumusae]
MKKMSIYNARYRTWQLRTRDRLFGKARGTRTSHFEANPQILSRVLASDPLYILASRRLQLLPADEMAVSQELGDTQLNTASAPSSTRRSSKRKSNATAVYNPEELGSSPKRNKSSLPFSQIVTLQIGDNKFVAPKHFICAKSELVRATIDMFMERLGRTRDVVYLPDLCPTGFQVYLNWVYRDRIDYELLDSDTDGADEGCEDEMCGIRCRGDRKSILMKRIRLHEMATKLQDSALQETLIDDMIAKGCHLHIDDALIKDCLGRGYDMSSKMIQWMADVYIVHVGREHFSRDTDLPSAFLLFVMERMKSRSRNDDLNDYPAWEGRYQYHEIKEEA